MLKWLDRTLVYGPYYSLCLSEESFKKELKKLKVEGYSTFLNPGANATAHYFTSDGGKLSCIVCMHPSKDRSLIEIHGLLVHEAVHIFDEAMEHYGEDKPSSEFKAYAIQNLSQNLFSAYKKLVKKMGKKK